MKRWRCKVCGYIHTGEAPPEKCPVCGAPKSQFELLEDEGIERQKEKAVSPPVEKNADAITAPGSGLKCQVCGYVHRAGEAPEKCPVCAAPQNRFEGQNSATPGKVETASPQEPPTAEPITLHSLSRTIKPMSQLVAKADLLTRWHAHPIAVHIPNGVLPVMLFFTFLAILFKSEPLAVAAKYNCIFVAISMPVVLITGFIDWFNRFDGYLTSVFKIKIACGAIVTALTLVLALWWATNPQIYLSGEPILYLFILINFLDFAAAAVAGFYGGKLVFRD